MIFRLVSLFFIFFSNLLFATTFYTNPNFEILFVDKIQVKNINRHKAVNLTQGEHQLVIRYGRMFEYGGDDAEIINSEPIIIKLNIDNQQKISLIANPPRTYKQGKKYAKNPIFSLVNENNNQINFDYLLLPKKSGFQLARDFLTEINNLELTDKGKKIAWGDPVLTAGTILSKQQVQKLQQPKTIIIQTANQAETDQAIKAINNNQAIPQNITTKVVANSNQPKKAIIPVINPTKSQDEVIKTSNTNIEMLKFWYQKANIQTKKDFKIWVINQTQVANTNTELEMLQFWHKKANQQDKQAFQIWLIQNNL